MKTYMVIKINAGYGVKSFSNLEDAKAFAEKCCKANNNNNYAVYVKRDGFYEEV